MLAKSPNDIWGISIDPHILLAANCINLCRMHASIGSEI